MISTGTSPSRAARLSTSSPRIPSKTAGSAAPHLIRLGSGAAEALHGDEIDRDRAERRHRDEREHEAEDAHRARTRVTVPGAGGAVGLVLDLARPVREVHQGVGQEQKPADVHERAPDRGERSSPGAGLSSPREGVRRGHALRRHLVFACPERAEGIPVDALDGVGLGLEHLGRRTVAHSVDPDVEDQRWRRRWRRRRGCRVGHEHLSGSVGGAGSWHDATAERDAAAR